MCTAIHSGCELLRLLSIQSITHTYASNGVSLTESPSWLTESPGKTQDDSERTERATQEEDGSEVVEAEVKEAEVIEVEVGEAEDIGAVELPADVLAVSEPRLHPRFIVFSGHSAITDAITSTLTSDSPSTSDTAGSGMMNAASANEGDKHGPPS